MPTVEDDGLTRIFHNGIILVMICLTQLPLSQYDSISFKRLRQIPLTADFRISIH